MEKLKQLFASNKFRVLLASTIGLLITKIFKVQVDPSTVMEFVILIGGWMVGQGFADYGKGAAVVEAVAQVNAVAGNKTTTAQIDAIKSV